MPEEISSEASQPEFHILLSARHILEQGSNLLTQISHEQYTLKIPLAFNSSIGGHYRHCLDHFETWLASIPSQLVDFDTRQRNPRVETDIPFALETTARLMAHLSSLNSDILHASVHSRCTLSHSNLSLAPSTPSTQARELVYVINHAIHHYAIISILARIMDIQLPPNFGIAPSTLAHQKTTGG